MKEHVTAGEALDKAYLTEGAEDPVDHGDYPKRVRVGRYKRYEFGGHRNMAPGAVKLREESKLGDKTFIDLFCGVGGATLGMMQAGFRELVGIDLSIDCIVTQKWNLDNELIMASVTHLPLRACVPVDLVFGSPPCVGFSAAARAARKNPKTRARHEKINQLVVDFAKAIMWLSPKAVIFENVPPVKKTWVFKEMLYILQFECYPPYWVEYKDIDAADYGVPQHRVRTILIAKQKEDLRLVEIIVPFGGSFDHILESTAEQREKLLSPQRTLEDLWRFVPDVVS